MRLFFKKKNYNSPSECLGRLKEKIGKLHFEISLLNDTISATSRELKNESRSFYDRRVMKEALAKAADNQALLNHKLKKHEEEMSKTLVSIQDLGDKIT
jgi:seryl-tRNA synthetase